MQKISCEKIEKSDKTDYKLQQVTTNGYEWLRVRLRVTSSDCKWLQIIKIDCESE